MPRLTPRVLLTSIITAFIVISLILYSTVDSRANQREEIYEQNDREISRLRQKIQHLGEELKENDNVVNKLEKSLHEAPVPPNPDVDVDAHGGKVKVVHEALHKAALTPAPDAKQVLIPPTLADAVCPTTAVHYSSASNIQMLKAYDTIPFDNIDGGVWKQGWDIKYDNASIQKEKKLEVVIVPHSHDDPGWLMTFEDYYSQQVHGIFDDMLSYLTAHPDMKFIYAEMSFFELWWSNLSPESRKAVKKLTNNGQLEIVTGAWVMTDEANSHYYATIMEMIEGHEFLVNQLDFRPSNHWSIDPFGLSPTLSYVVKAGNFSHLAVQRVHYSVKKYLAQNKNLEFVWRQLWAGNDDRTDIITHMFPFYSYDIPHTCGPDPTVCCQFDFRRAYEFSCPWGKPAKMINADNVVERSRLIADQYRKKAQLYKTNVLLVPLGDDFRYSGGREFKAQHENYNKLFEQINSDTTLNMHLRFGTLKDYFSLLDKRRAEDPKGLEFETLSGDFFTYADRDDHYWSGYFTSRPFYKHMDRSLGHYLRSADLAFSLANWKSETSEKKWPGIELYDHLVDARRALSLFQHHDGVTGTARDPVVEDYGEKMVQALNWSKRIIASAAEYLLQFPVMRDAGLKIDEEHSLKELPVKSVVEDGGAIVVQNSLGHTRNEVVCIHVNSFKSRITKTDSDATVAQQIEPIISLPEAGDRFVIDKDKFQLCFLASIPPFGFARYELFEAQDTATVATIEASGSLESSDFQTKIFAGSVIELANEYVTAKFDTHTGLLTSVKSAGCDELPVEMSFVHYGARGHDRSRNPGGDSLSGAYLFLPNGEAKPLSNAENAFVVVAGPVRKTVVVKGPKQIKLLQTVSLDYNSAHLNIRNLVDIRSQGNFEAAMRLKTGIIDGEQFYTELNGYQIIRRKRFAKLPLQAHFYPMPGAAFIEDSHQRLSLLGRQALGVASLRPGWMEVMLDRRLDQDDDRGLAQPVHDNLRTESLFRLVLEQVKGPAPEADPTVGYHSLATSVLSAQLHYPPVLLIGQLDHAASSEVSSSVAGLAKPLPCDVHPVALRTLSLPTKYGSNGERSTNPQNSAALILQRYGVECRIPSKLSITCENVDANNKFGLKGLFTDPLKNARSASLTLLYTDESSEVNEVTLVPMELKSVKLNF